MKFRRILSVFLVSLLLTLALSPTALAAEQLTPPQITAKAALLVDTADDIVLYAKNESARMYPASITKVMTCFLILEAVERGDISMDDMVTAQEGDFFDMEPDGSNAGIKPGETMSLRDLLYCMMLVSANEACNIVARHLDGNIPAFIQRMNDRATQLGLTNTHFTNTSGLHNPDHYTTAWDIYVLAKEAMKNETFRTITNTLAYTTAATNMAEPRELHTTNSLISNWRILGLLYDGAEGIKTGTTEEAGNCLLSSAYRHGRRLICVVLGSSGSGVDVQSFPDSSKLYDYGFDSFSNKTILTSNELVYEMPVELSKQTNAVVLHPAYDAESILPNVVDPSQLERKIELVSEVAYAPIQAGDTLGQITLSYGDRVCATVPLLAQYDVTASRFLTVKHQIFTFFDQTIVKVILLVLAVLVAAIVVWWKFFRRKRRYGRSSSAGRRRSYRGRRR